MKDGIPKFAATVRRVQSELQLTQAGDYHIMPFALGNSQQLLYLACPGCGKILNLSGHTIVCAEPLTIRRSLLCQFCRFHAWVTDGEVERIDDTNLKQSVPPEERV